MDIYTEQLVTKRRTGGDVAKIALTLLGCMLLGAAVVFFSLISGFLVLIIVGLIIIGVGAWIAAGFGVEYEYIVTNNEMDIDKILGKRKRKRMITVDLSKATQFESMPEAGEKNVDVTVYASTGMEKDAHVLICEHSDYGTVKIIFNPNENTRKAIGQGLPPALRRKVNDNG